VIQTKLGYDVSPVKPLAAKLGAFYQSIQPPGPDPMLDFDERDLVRHAEQPGFADMIAAKPGCRPG
jgi:hypothetical protein